MSGRIGLDIADGIARILIDRPDKISTLAAVVPLPPVVTINADVALTPPNDSVVVPLATSVNV